MQLSVNPDEIRQFSRYLSDAAQNMHIIVRETKVRTESLNQHWDDPQFKDFAEVIGLHGANAVKAVEAYEMISSQVMRMAELLEDTVKKQQEMLRNIRTP